MPSFLHNTTEKSVGLDCHSPAGKVASARALVLPCFVLCDDSSGKCVVIDLGASPGIGEFTEIESP